MKNTLLIFIAVVLVAACKKSTTPDDSNCYSCVTYDSIYSNIPKLEKLYDTVYEQHCDYTDALINIYVKQHTITDTPFYEGDTIEIKTHVLLCSEQ